MIKIERTTAPRLKPAIEGIPFGTYFSDHMFTMQYVKGTGWFDAKIVPYGTIALEPAAMVFHYAQEVFEGMKAYRGADGKIRLFRPTENINRMNNSCDRLCIPRIPEDIFMEALKTLVEVDQDWVTSEPDPSLYIRPFVIATDPHVGVHASHSYLFCIITCPVGSYYPEGINPVKIMIEGEDVRAVRGGTGFAKCGGNYAASLRAGEVAAAKGFSQVLWLDGVEQKYVEEVGSMNMMFAYGNKIVTPMLNGSILPGITRDSVLKLARSMGYETEEGRLDINEIFADAKSGKLTEAFGTGTAAVISPVGTLAMEDEKITIGDGGIGKVAQSLYDTLTGIQYGRLEDKFGWIVKL